MTTPVPHWPVKMTCSGRLSKNVPQKLGPVVLPISRYEFVLKVPLHAGSPARQPSSAAEARVVLAEQRCIGMRDEAVITATCATDQPTSCRSLRPSSAACATWTSSDAPRGSTSCGRQAHQPGPHHPAFTYHGWLWDTRRGPPTPLARSVLSWSGATASLPNFRAHGGRAARCSWCAGEPGSARADWSGSSRTGSGTRAGLSWLAGAARLPGTCRSVLCGRPCSLPPVSGWRHRRGSRHSGRSWGRWFLSGLASMPGGLTAG